MASSLYTSPPEGRGDPASRSLKKECLAQSFGPGACNHDGGRRDVLHAHAGQVAHGDLGVGAPPGPQSRRDLPQLAGDPVLEDRSLGDGVMDLAQPETLIPAV